MQLDVNWSEKVKYIKEMVNKLTMPNHYPKEEIIDEVTSVWYRPVRTKVFPETEMEPSRTKPLSVNVSADNDPT